MPSLAQSGLKWLQADLVKADNRMPLHFFLQLLILAIVNGLLFLFTAISAGDAALQ